MSVLAGQVVLDEMGAERGATALDAAGQLVVGRPEAVYFYTPDGRGPCFVFEGVLNCTEINAALLNVPSVRDNWFFEKVTACSVSE